MVGKVIRDYMEGGAKKLTVPGFGTFMRREGTQGGSDIIFVDLLRVDDSNTLGEMVEDRGGLTELEAMARIDRWIFETRNALERNGRSVIEGFGTFTIDHRGGYKFNHSPVARPTKETAVQERLFDDANRKHEKSEGFNPRSTKHSADSMPSASADGLPRRTHTKGFSPTSKKRKPATKSSRMDIIIIVAITAAVIALVALVFGMSSAGMPFLSK